MSGTPCACAYLRSAAALGAAGRAGLQPSAIWTRSDAGSLPFVRPGFRFGRLDPTVGGIAIGASPPFGGPGVGTGVGVGVACGRPIAAQAEASVASRTRSTRRFDVTARYGTA